MERKVWLKSYPDTIPHEIDPDEYTSLTDALDAWIEQFKEREAFENFGTSIRYWQLGMLSRQLAAYFQQVLTLEKGDRIALMLPNCLQYPIVLLAALRLGLVIVNVNPLYTPYELDHQLNDAGARAIIVLSNFVSTLASVYGRTSLEHVIVTELGDPMPWPKRWVINTVSRFKHPVSSGAFIKGSLAWFDIMKQAASLTFNEVPIHSSDLAFLQYTGGTTGIAKGAKLTHRTMLANIAQCVAWVAPKLSDQGEQVIIALPLYHIFSLTVCCLSFLKLGGTGHLVTNPRDIKGFIRILKGIQFTVFVGLNTLFSALLQQKAFKAIDFSALRLNVSGGMPLQPHIAKAWQAATGCPVLEGYGLTEASPVVSVNTPMLTHYNGSIGFPLPSTEVSIRDDKGCELAIGARGELWVRGPQVMAGYWNNESETAEVMTAEGWLKTGDIGYLDEVGRLFLVDRKKDMICVSGFNVYPSEVEAVIARCPGVHEVAVVGVEDEKTREAVKAFIVADASVSERDIRAYCESRLTAYKRPKLIEFRDELPKSNVGKVVKRLLK